MEIQMITTLGINSKDYNPKAVPRLDIKIVDQRGKDGLKYQHLYINDRWVCTYPRMVDGNQVAHSVSLELRSIGLDSTYEFVIESEQDTILTTNATKNG